MPTANFIPLIGSSFDSLANQGQYWAGFNSRVDEANLRRLQEAEMAQNQWFSRLAEMQQQEAARQDRLRAISEQTAQKAAADRLQAQQFAAQTAQQKQEFDRRQKLAEDTLAWNKSQKDTELKKQLKVVTNFATSFAPEFQDTAQSLQAAETRHRMAQDAVLKRKSQIEAEADFPRTDVHFDPRTHEFVPNEIVRGQPKVLIGNALQIVQSANKELAGLSADYLTSQAELNQRQAEWTDKLKLAQGYNLVPKRGKGGAWALYSPDLDMTFGQMVEAEKTKEPFKSQINEWEISKGKFEGPVWQGQTTSTATTPAVPTPAPTVQSQAVGLDQAPGFTPAPVGAPPIAPPVLAPAQPPFVTTKAQFDALPPGAIYIGKDGKRYQKPSGGNGR